MSYSNMVLRLAEAVGDTDSQPHHEDHSDGLHNETLPHVHLHNDEQQDNPSTSTITTANTANCLSTWITTTTSSKITPTTRTLFIYLILATNQGHHPKGICG